MNTDLDSLGDDSPQEPVRNPVPPAGQDAAFGQPVTKPDSPSQPGQQPSPGAVGAPRPANQPLTPPARPQQPQAATRTPVSPPPPPPPPASPLPTGGGAQPQSFDVMPPNQQPQAAPTQPASSQPPASTTAAQPPSPQPSAPRPNPNMPAQPTTATPSKQKDSNNITPFGQGASAAGEPQSAVTSDAPAAKQAHDFKPLLKKAAKVLAFLGIVWLGASLLNAFIFQTYYVNGQSMTPTLNDSDRLIVTKVAKTQAMLTGSTFVPDRGDIVVISSEVSAFTASQHEQIIKRIIALQGERVTIASGDVTVYNDANPGGIDVNKELGLTLTDTYSAQPVDTTLPDDSVFVLGDNRRAGGSFDSRDFGPVPLDYIEGRLWMRILPLTQIHIF